MAHTVNIQHLNHSIKCLSKIKLIPSRSNLHNVGITKVSQICSTRSVRFECKLVLSYNLNNRNLLYDKNHIKDYINLCVKKCYSMDSDNDKSLDCWQCGSKQLNYQQFCENCQVVQPLPSDINYFKILNIDTKFKMNLKDISKVYKNLQNVFHPDKFVNKSSAEQELALVHSSAINNAYRTLRHPVKRAVYMLELNGQSLEEGHMELNQEFLMAMMEINEKLADAEDRETVAIIGHESRKTLDQLLEEAENAFNHGDVTTAREVVAKIKYYNNIYEKVQEYERYHGIIN